MHNITKIKLFRILLRITYLPSLILLYPLAFFRKKSNNGLFFFFDRYSLGGAQRIHLDILKSIPETEKQIFFTRYSPNAVFYNEFYAIPNSESQGYPYLVRLFIISTIFRSLFQFLYKQASVRARYSAANSTFFYDMLPFINKKFKRTELLHNFTFGKNGMEFFGLINYRLLTNRIVYDYYTKENIEKQYAGRHIDLSYLQRILFIEPGVDIPPEKKKSFDGPLKIICAGRGGPQKRIWLVNRIAEYFIDQNLPISFHFAGTLIGELSEKVRTAMVIHGEISDPKRMSGLLADSDIALLTSLYEGFPMFIKESMSHGCIPVVTALPGYLMHLKDRTNCLLIPEIMDETAVVQQGIEKIMELERDKNLCNRVSRRSLSVCKKLF